jgi:ubiquinone/menaquinone biosynthesis C-methylase UbiE
VSSGSRLQAAYYARSAAEYDARHVSAADEHGVALRYVSALLREFDLDSLLDVGSGTGRVTAYFNQRQPHLRIVGVDPVLPLLQHARAKPRARHNSFACASGYHLPFTDRSFDAVCQFGVLHHAEAPNAVVREMLRVARRAVFLSDSNRFGQGPIVVRWVKLTLARTGLWPLANLLKTRGKQYTVSQGDGVAYSYSVYDSLNLLQSWADRLVLVPTSERTSRSWYAPLLTSSHVAVCAIREYDVETRPVELECSRS